MTSITCLSGGKRGVRRKVEVMAYLCQALTLWTLHECDAWIGSVWVGLGIGGIAGNIGGGLGRRGECDGRGL